MLTCTADETYRVTLQPKVAVPASRLSNESPTCAKWSPHAPNNEVLVGTQWGTVAVIKLHDAVAPEEPSYTVCSLVRTDISSIRCLAWAPVETHPGDDPSDNSTLFCSCAGQALITIYDTRQPQIPVLDLSLGSTGAPPLLPTNACARVYTRVCIYSSVSSTYLRHQVTPACAVQIRLGSA